MKDKYSIDKKYLEQRKEDIWLALESDLYKSGISRCGKNINFTPKQSVLFEQFTSAVASYDAYKKYLDEYFFTEHDDLSKDFVHLLSQYVMSSEFCKFSKENYEDNLDILEGISFNGFKPYKRPETMEGSEQNNRFTFNSDVSLFVDSFSRKLYDAISALEKSTTKNDLYNMLITLSYQYMDKYRHTLKDELSKEKFGTLINKLSGKPIEIDSITLDGLVELNGKSNHDIVPRKLFSEVIGNKTAKTILKDLGYKLLFYDKKYGNPANPARTVLLLGEPGGGKTMLIQAVYNYLIDNAPKKTDISFYEISPTIMSKWAGEAENRMKEIFNSADKPDKISLIAIEDIDMMLYNRDDKSSSGGIKDSLMSTLMNLLEGVGSTPKGNYLVLTTTNKDHHLDEALRKRISNIQVYVPGPKTVEDYSSLLESLHKQKLETSYDSVVDISSEDFDEISSLLISSETSSQSIDKITEFEIASAKLSGRDIRNIVYSMKEESTRLIDKDDEFDVLPTEKRNILDADIDAKYDYLENNYGKITPEKLKNSLKTYISESKKLLKNSEEKKIEKAVDGLMRNKSVEQEYIKRKKSISQSL